MIPPVPPTPPTPPQPSPNSNSNIIITAVVSIVVTLVLVALAFLLKRVGFFRFFQHGNDEAPLLDNENATANSSSDFVNPALNDSQDQAPSTSHDESRENQLPPTLTIPDPNQSTHDVLPNLIHSDTVPFYEINLGARPRTDRENPIIRREAIRTLQPFLPVATGGDTQPADDEEGIRVAPAPNQFPDFPGLRSSYDPNLTEDTFCPYFDRTLNEGIKDTPPLVRKARKLWKEAKERLSRE